MSISEQVKELREVAEMYEGLDGGKILSEAADTIEALSAKLADMERSAEDCGGGWILCSKQLPEEGKEILLQDHCENIEIAKFGHNAFYQNGFYNGDWFSTVNNYLAWQYLPAPYHEP